MSDESFIDNLIATIEWMGNDERNFDEVGLRREWGKLEARLAALEVEHGGTVVRVEDLELDRPPKPAADVDALAVEAFRQFIGHGGRINGLLADAAKARAEAERLRAGCGWCSHTGKVTAALAVVIAEHKGDPCPYCEERLRLREDLRIVRKMNRYASFVLAGDEDANVQDAADALRARVAELEGAQAEQQLMDEVVDAAADVYEEALGSGAAYIPEHDWQTPQGRSQQLAAAPSGGAPMTGPSKRAELKVLHAAHAAGKVSDCPTCAVPQPSASDEETAELMCISDRCSGADTSPCCRHIAQALAQARRQGAANGKEDAAQVAERWAVSEQRRCGGLRTTAVEMLEGLAAAIRALPDE